MRRILLVIFLCLILLLQGCAEPTSSATPSLADDGDPLAPQTILPEPPVSGEVGLMARAVQAALSAEISQWNAGLSTEEPRTVRAALRLLEQQDVLSQFVEFELPESEAFSIAVLLDIPDFESFPLEAENVQPPIEEYMSRPANEASLDYQKALEENADAHFASWIEGDYEIPLLEVEVLLDIRKDGENWLAVLQPAEMIKVTESVRQGYQEKISHLLEESEFRTIYAVQAMQARLDALPYPMELEEVLHNSGNNYSVSILSPEPEALFRDAAEAATDRIRIENPSGLYGAPDEEYLRAILAEQVASASDAEVISTSMFIHFPEDIEAWPTSDSLEFSRFLSDFESAMAPVVEMMKDSLADLQREAEEMPGTGVISGERRGTRFRAELPGNGQSYYLRVYKESEDSPGEPGEFQQGAFIEAGDSLSSRLPDGTYIVKYSYGTAWFGEDIAFGQFAPYYLLEEPVIVTDEAYDLALDAENSGATPIEYDAF